MKLSYAFWILCAMAGLLGGVVGVTGIYIEATFQDTKGLYMIMMSSFLLVLAGIFATLAVKFEAEKV